MIGVDDDLGVGSGLPASYACIGATWTTIDTLLAVWARCEVGKRPSEYREDAFIFQNDTKSFRVTVRLPESGDSLADASEIIWRAYHPTTKATVLEKTLTDTDITILTATTFQFTLDNSETGIAPMAYRHEIQITNNSGEPSTVLTGTFRVIDTVIGDA